MSKITIHRFSNNSSRPSNVIHAHYMNQYNDDNEINSRKRTESEQDSISEENEILKKRKIEIENEWMAEKEKQRLIESRHNKVMQIIEESRLEHKEAIGNLNKRFNKQKAKMPFISMEQRINTLVKDKVNKKRQELTMFFEKKIGELFYDDNINVDTKEFGIQTDEIIKDDFLPKHKTIIASKSIPFKSKIEVDYPFSNPKTEKTDTMDSLLDKKPKKTNVTNPLFDTKTDLGAKLQTPIIEETNKIPLISDKKFEVPSKKTPLIISASENLKPNNLFSNKRIGKDTINNPTDEKMKSLLGKDNEDILFKDPKSKNEDTNSMLLDKKETTNPLINFNHEKANIFGSVNVEKKSLDNIS